MLPIIDRQWVDHLYVMDHLKTGIGLRGYGQKDPRVEYEKEAFEIFESLKNNIADEAIKGVFRVQIEHGAPPQQMMAPGAPQFEQIPSGEMVPQPVTGAGNALPPQQVEQLLGPVPGAGRRVAAVPHEQRRRGTRKADAARSAESRAATNYAPAAAVRSISVATARRHSGIGVRPLKLCAPQSARPSNPIPGAAIQAVAR